MRIQRGMDLPNQIIFSLLSPHSLSAIGNGVWTGRELRVAMLHAERKHKVITWLTQSS